MRSHCWKNLEQSSSLSKRIIFLDAPKHYHKAMIEARKCLVNEKEWIHGRYYFQENAYW